MLYFELLLRKSTCGKIEAEITFERKEMATRFQSKGYPHIFDHARLRYGTDDMARHRSTPEIQNGGHQKPEVEISFERKYISTGFQRLPQHKFQPCRHCRHGPTSADIENQKCLPRKPTISVQKLFPHPVFVADIFGSLCRLMSGRVGSVIS